jgi:hypothetical protein
MLLKIVNKALNKQKGRLSLPRKFYPHSMSEYEKTLQKRLKRDIIVGIGIISLLVIIYLTSMTLL